LDGSGDLETVYGRIDLSDYVNPVEKKGLSIKELFVQVRYPGEPNTGAFNPTLALQTATAAMASLKVFATTRAYQDAADVGIASPDVFHVEEWTARFSGGGAGGDSATLSHQTFGPTDLHPDGYIVVSDILIGIATDDCTIYNSATLEIDIMLVAQPITVSSKDLTFMLTQSQDL